MKSFVSCACRQDIMMPSVLQAQLPNLSLRKQGTFQVCCLTIGFCENVLKISILLVAFSCKHLLIWILIENFHPNVDFIKKVPKDTAPRRISTWLIRDVTIR